MRHFDQVLQPGFKEVFNSDYPLKGQWAGSFFRNDQPVVLELGCGKGEYTVGLARKFPEKNFIGIDIKGARMWKGARIVKEEGLPNAGFLRTRIEFAASFFGPEEVAEIWITFPDPQLKKRRNKKRLTSARFLNTYLGFLKPGGLIHLKTDNEPLYNYTLDLIKRHGIGPLKATPDLYGSGMADEILSIRTFYESQFLSEGLRIHYLCFCPSPVKEFNELSDA